VHGEHDLWTFALKTTCFPARARVILGLLHNKKLLELSWVVTKALYCLWDEGSIQEHGKISSFFLLRFERQSCRCNLKLMKKRFTRLGIAKNISIELTTVVCTVKMLRHILFEMSIVCDGSRKVLCALRNFSDALTLSYAVNGTAIFGAFHEAWDLDFCSLHRTSWP